MVPTSFSEALCTGFKKKNVICAKPEWFSGLLNTGTFCLSAHGVLFWNQEEMEAQKEILCGQMSFVRMDHTQCLVWLHPRVFSRNQGLLGTPIFLIFAIGTSCKLLIFTCACSTITTTDSHCKGRLHDSDHSNVRQRGVEHKGINALITTESHLFQWSSSV